MHAKRRRSVTRQLSGRYQRTTNRKVEGREIQQVSYNFDYFLSVTYLL